MLFGYEELCSREVIDISSGERLGFIDDIELDIASGNVRAFIIYGRVKLLGLLGRDDDTYISCQDIKVIGDDVLLIERQKGSSETKFTKKQRKRFLSLLK
ncbi:YlmC/YmxH family sporulation protein [Ruminococcus flavefaciens]|uniref:PRC-barrel domain-containing protein n=1 Tax=Ruminococcus flavefaciens 007c TaxID=1341157 RepID=W7UHW5_RUMFL|nr:YlmC/YmxH family sporulation protein [Ruminococcus flavefaciens]EWM53583.1 hypothetical protein RF007C_05860 [Ruminococcus flavefaciens 007c]